MLAGPRHLQLGMFLVCSMALVFVPFLWERPLLHVLPDQAGAPLGHTSVLVLMFTCDLVGKFRSDPIKRG